MERTELRIGSRASPLARMQAGMAADALAGAAEGPPPGHIVVPIRTRGDTVQDRPLSEMGGGKGIFTRELDEALLEGRIDFAVHSMKDMPTELREGIAVAAVLPREDPRDVLVAAGGPAGSLGDLPRGAAVGTSSPRRAAQVLHLRPDVEVRPLRGNVGTRLRRIREGRADATLLAAAGLLRLGRDALAATPLPCGEMLPAPAQGAIAIACREGDEGMRALAARVDDAAARAETDAERAFLEVLSGDCHTPAAALARMADGRISFDARLLNPDGTGLVEARRDGAAADSAEMGRDAAAEVLGAGGRGA